MKMPRSHCENDNVQFVQELAEVDGPFESPININFRDLTKLELPSLTWNRSESCPKKMKITNTGHTVIISGKWKCERPYLTGGPLLGKYVFSQIHFHWGQDDCRGSEHQICGEGFPLEMHVVHFKTEYLTQESALREKDGMVVVVYLFKLQEEPNAGLIKILNLLPHVQQANTSHAVDPRPILSLCNPFTDDYFMYWGSVVTSTCAHILLWIVCREPFGISKEQVNEFRKILDPSQQPISRNSRDTQPLHRRNVFHVNASKNLDDPMLPIKKIIGCYCKGSEENISVKQTANDCSCQSQLRHQEDIEGNNTLSWKMDLPKDFSVHQSIFVQSATVQSAPLLPNIFGNDPVKNLSFPNSVKQTTSEGNSKIKSVSQSCCFFSMYEVNKIKTRSEKTKSREDKVSFNSMKALSHLMDSLEALKNHTLKKLKEIECINQEIKGMKSFCQDTEDRRWLRRIEEMMTRQKQFTIKTSQGCFSELKKLAKECNFDKFFDNRALSVGDNKMVWLNNANITDKALSCSNVYETETENTMDSKNTTLKSFNIRNAAKFSEKVQKLIQSFFEDVKENEGLQKSVQKDLHLKKIGSPCSRQGGDSPSVVSIAKGYITQKMFNLGNLEDRFFSEVLTDEIEKEENVWNDKTGTNAIVISPEKQSSKKCVFFRYSEKTIKTNSMRITDTRNPTSDIYKEEIIPLHRVNVGIGFPPRLKTTLAENLKQSKNILASDEEQEDYHLDINGKDSKTELKRIMRKPYLATKPNIKNSLKKVLRKTPKMEANELIYDKLVDDFEEDFLTDNQNSSSNLSSYSSETQRMIIAKFHKKQSRKDIWRQRPSAFARISTKNLYERTSYKKNKLKNINFEGYYIKKKKFKSNKKKISGREKIKIRTSSCDFSSTSKETKMVLRKSKWQRLTKARFKLEIEKTSDSTLESAIEYSLISPERKKLKLECKKIKTSVKNRKISQIKSTQTFLTDSDTQVFDARQKSFINLNAANKMEEGDWTVLGNDDDSLRRQKRRIHIHLSSANASRTPSKVSKTRTFRASSVDSSYSDEQESFKIKKLQSPTEGNNDKIQNFLVPKKAIKNRSLSNLINKTKYHSKIKQRVFLENVDDRRINAKETSELRRDLEPSKRPEEIIKVITVKNVSRGTSNETYRIADRAAQTDENYKPKSAEPYNLQSQKAQKYEIGFFTTASKQMDEELMTTAQLQEGKDMNPIIKRCDAEKYHFLNKELQQVQVSPPEGTEEHQELLKATDSNKFLSVNDDRRLVKVGPTMKGDSNIAYSEDKDIKDLKASVPYSTIKINSQSRPRSAESLDSLKKVSKRRRKKRPHCCKRSSKHHIRKNSTIFKKPNKVESKPQNFIDLTEEEQLKIISVNVAKYLKQKLVEQKNEDSKNGCSFKEIEQVVLQNLNASEREKNETLMKEKSCEQEIEIQQKESFVAKETKEGKKDECPEVETQKVEEQKKEKVESAKEKKACISPRPVHNFIKLNKQMAGKYKRLPPSFEKKLENQLKKKDVPQKETTKAKMKVSRKKKDKHLSPKQEDELEVKPESQLPLVTLNPLEKKSPGKTLKEIRVKNSPSPKKLDSERKNQKGYMTEKEPKEENKEESQADTQVSSLAIQKVSQPKKRWIPAYMLTSYLPSPIEIVENQQRKMNRCLLNINTSNMGSYLPEIMYETKKRCGKKKGEKNDSLFTKDLEYLIRLQMCLNNEISANIENSMNYVKTLLSQDYNGTAIIEKAPVNGLLDLYESHNKGIVLIEMNDLLDCSSSSSDFAEDQPNYRTEGNPTNSKNKYEEKTEKISKMKIPKESGDSEIISPAMIRELNGQEDCNSDSSYNCEISITLNTGINDGEGEMKVYDPPSCPGEFSNYTYQLRRESNISQTTTQLDSRSSSQSIISKPHRKKRKENEISVEMKQKLLEILEGEIQREMALTYGISPENSSDGLTLKWEDSDGMNKSQSTESSCDNTEVLAQISETMRKYLSDLKEKRKLADITEKKIDKESKEKDAS